MAWYSIQERTFSHYFAGRSKRSLCQLAKRDNYHSLPSTDTKKCRICTCLLEQLQFIATEDNPPGSSFGHVLVGHAKRIKPAPTLDQLDQKGQGLQSSYKKFLGYNIQDCC